MPNILKYRRANRYIRDAQGKSRPRYLASCGHETQSPHARSCRACYLKAYPRLGNNGYSVAGARASGERVYIHRQVAEAALGRSLRRGEVVHHIDGDKSNNMPQNLLICSRAYHGWLHFHMAQRYMEEHFGASKERETTPILRGGTFALA